MFIDYNDSMDVDIFCRVIDNYGDIGISWRLARHMKSSYQWNVRLWVSNLQAFSCIQPEIDSRKNQQELFGIRIIFWDNNAHRFFSPRDVVIGVLSSDIPSEFLKKMYINYPIWVSFEYLSAESWIEEHHGLPSRRSDGLVRYFFFPGMKTNTGGMLLEPNLLKERDAMAGSRLNQEVFLKNLPLKKEALIFWRSRPCVITLFCYENAPILALLEILVLNSRPTLILLLQGVAVDLEKSFFSSTLHFARVPFVNQEDFDRLLWCSDLNIVRGEDSFSRAMWAAKPMVWHIYPQQENVHLLKLKAWLNHYQAPKIVESLIWNWNSVHKSCTKDFQSLWESALHPKNYLCWKIHAQEWARKQSTQTELGYRLAKFCKEIKQKDL